MRACRIRLQKFFRGSKENPPSNHLALNQALDIAPVMSITNMICSCLDVKFLFHTSEQFVQLIRSAARIRRAKYPCDQETKSSDQSRISEQICRNGMDGSHPSWESVGYKVRLVFPKEDSYGLFSKQSRGAEKTIVIARML